MHQRDLFHHPTPIEPKAGTQKAEILAALRRAEFIGTNFGVSNVTLNNIAFRFSARIHELKHKNHFQIRTGPTLANGLVHYYLTEKNQ